MSRKEEIEKAAWCNYPLIKGGEEQFIQGAEWADRTFLNNLWHDSSKETPIQGSNILMIRKDEKDSNYPPIAGCFHGTNSRLDGRNWGYYNGFCYNEIEPPLKWAYVDDLLNLSNVQRTVKNWKEELISEDLEEAAENHAVERYIATRDMVLAEKCKWSFKEGANWKREQIAKENMLLPFKEYDNLMESINKRKKEGYEAGYKQGLVDSKSE